MAFERFKKWLPVVAVISAGLMVISFMSLSIRRRSILEDTGETRSIVEAALNRLDSLHTPALDDPNFLKEVARAAKGPYIAYLWIITPEGTVTYSSGGVASIASRSKDVHKLATDETRRILGELEEGTLTGAQEVRLLAASALQAEGEHNDVFRYMVRDIHGRDGKVVGMAGVAYNVSTLVDARPDIGWRLGLVGFLVGFGFYWFALPLWTFLDARAHGERAFVWAAFVTLANLLGLITYLLARRPVRG